MNDINYKDEREEEIPCKNESCPFYKIMHPQNCAGQSPDHDPAVEFCTEYEPVRSVN